MSLTELANQSKKEFYTAAIESKRRKQREDYFNLRMKAILEVALEAKANELHPGMKPMPKEGFSYYDGIAVAMGFTASNSKTWCHFRVGWAFNYVNNTITCLFTSNHMHDDSSYPKGARSVPCSIDWARFDADKFQDYLNACWKWIDDHFDYKGDLTRFWQGFKAPDFHSEAL